MDLRGIQQGEFLGDGGRCLQRILPAWITQAVLVMVRATVVLHDADELRRLPVLHGSGSYLIAERIQTIVVQLIDVVIEEVRLLPARVVSHHPPVEAAKDLTLNFGIDQCVDQRHDEALERSARCNGGARGDTRLPAGRRRSFAR